MAAVMLPPLALCHGAGLRSQQQLRQAEALQAQGFVLRNTFIDEATPPPGGDSSRRASSAPPPATPGSRQAGARERAGLWEGLLGRLGDEEGGGPGAAECCSRLPCPSVSGASSRSTTASEIGSCDIFDSEAGSPAALRGEGAWPGSPSPGTSLAELVERECAFMRIRGHALSPLNRGQMKHGATMCLRFFVHGLPFTRRSKWQQPLIYSVAAVLKRCGCPAAVRGGELYAPADANGSSEVVVRIDFAAGRH